MKIATLLCVYGGDEPEAFRRAVDSITAQRLESGIESRIYLGVDGPVSAECERVMEELGPALYKIVRSSANLGFAKALNLLIAALEEEELVFRMDADDWSYPERYASQIAFLRLHPSVDILGTDILEVDRASGVQRIVEYSGGREDPRVALARGVPVAHPSVCVRRSVLIRTGGYPVCQGNEDIAFWFRCVESGFSFDNVRVPLLEFRVNERFWQRRSVGKAWGELVCYLRGIWAVNRLTWRYCYPVARFVLRLAPARVSRWAYALPMRARVTREAARGR